MGLESVTGVTGVINIAVVSVLGGNDGAGSRFLDTERRAGSDGGNFTVFSSMFRVDCLHSEVFEIFEIFEISELAEGEDGLPNDERSSMFLFGPSPSDNRLFSVGRILSTIS